MSNDKANHASTKQPDSNILDSTLFKIGGWCGPFGYGAVGTQTPAAEHQHSQNTSILQDQSLDIGELLDHQSTPNDIPSNIRLLLRANFPDLTHPEAVQDPGHVSEEQLTESCVVEGYTSEVDIHSQQQTEKSTEKKPMTITLPLRVR